MKRSRSFRSRLLASYVLLTAIPLLVLGTLFYQASLRVVTDQAQDNVYEIVRKNNELMDTKLRIIDQNSMALFTDRGLFELFNELDPSNGSELLAADRQVSDVLRNYFSRIDDVYTYQLWTSYFTFGQQLPQGDPTKSEVYRTAKEAGGRLVWYPTYDFADMFAQPDYARENIDFRQLFSATRVLDFSYLYNSILRRLDEEVERPVLVISFKSEALNELFAGSLPDRSRYLVLDEQNRVAAGDNPSLISRTYAEPWVKELQELGSGKRRMTLGGERVIVCFDRSEVTGWLSIVITPESSLIRELAPVIRTSTLLLAVIMTVAALALAYFISGKITKPVQRLTAAMRSVGEGDFDARVPVTSSDELGQLLRHFNRMNDRIGSLVTEVYETRLKEQEAEIHALNRQMNPHFLYNTLNVMNWMAIENDQRELSRMLVCLSNMLHYTSRREWGTVSLDEEIEWMNSYFYIMQARFEDKFTVEYDLDPRLFGYDLPRLTFQPFVENAILHGFEGLESGGLIRIAGRIEQGNRIYEIGDNGKGMEAAVLEAIAEEEGASVGIRNTIARIRMQYGPEASVTIESSPGEGTLVVIRLPDQSQS
ncbi:cache domain-containing sensor histidine kinase [Saccharibacillus qingshengii]|uniref:cache domain-containing sensor histidine kinase n=1 Tax=Saccharibacillus qingshengii TaxID=1763540 RepID=UPI00155736EF|nr:sensor histidine kinase [Saccharibacillus qingshengii]